ncbi:MAG: DNA polymerase III subunit delta [Planctomycetaceae bacterium]|jgi:DNA polymerase-3 subunit delta|nr:DNA polymerase III subunit delta [Planctomycetaceae bacterium]
MKPVSVHEYLDNVSKYPPLPVCVIFGNDGFLRMNAYRQLCRQVLADEESEFSLTRFDGGDLPKFGEKKEEKMTFKHLLQELQTAAMFGSGKRFVCFDEADKFVSENRAAFENYAVNPSQNAVLLLQLSEFASNTKLYKTVAESGLIIEAKTLSEKDMPQWVIKWSKSRYKIPCDTAAAEMMVQRVGGTDIDRGIAKEQHGLIDQELAKLSVLADSKTGITVDLVEKYVGSRRTQKVWDMLDLALAGQTAAALRQLDLLLLSGEHAVGILAQMSASLRKFAAATEIILDAERRKTKISVRSALEKAGVKGFILNKAEGQLLKLGRHRGGKLLKQLLQLDLALKGDSKADPRLLLETLIIGIAHPKLKEPLRRG